MVRTFSPETREARWVRSELRGPVGSVQLYRMFDRTGNLLYVGITNNPIERWRTHAQRKEWWHSVIRIEVEDYPSQRTALAAEVVAIRTESPLHNVRSAVS
jgi:predicted GIY-YIG superfamily endonuclease